MTVQDTAADTLFAGLYDAMIQNKADTSAGFQAHDRFYLVDEPFRSAFLAFGYVGNQIKARLGSGEVKAGTLTASYQGYARLLEEGQPCQLMVDPYFIMSSLPHPSVQNDALADEYGFARWNESNYLTGLQEAVQTYLFHFQWAALAASDAGKPWIVIPQLHGFFYETTGKYLDAQNNPTLRPPAPSELRLNVNLGLVYGAKGVLAFPFGTHYLMWDDGQFVAFPGLVSYRRNGGYYRDHWSNVDTLFGDSTWTGYKEKWDELSAINRRLNTIGDTLLALNWLGTKSWNLNPGSTGTWSGLVSNVTVKNYAGTTQPYAYVETGHFLHSVTGMDYLLVLNRRCAPSDSVYVTLTLQQATFAAIKVSDLERDTSWTILSGSAFTDLVHPGEMKIYKVEQGLIVTVDGPETLEPSETGIFTATTIGGTSPFEYEWWFYDECSGLDAPDLPLQPPCGQWNSSTIYDEEFPHQNETDFRVHCTVTDAVGREASSANHYVAVGAKLAKSSEEAGKRAGLPRHYALEGPYPNPFNPSTTLHLALPEDATVRIRIFDLVGREVARLSEGTLPAGYHNITWQARTLASGAYFAQAEVKDKDGKIVLSASHKLLLTR